jgi:hypothetical protein
LNDWLKDTKTRIDYLEETIKQINEGTLVDFGTDNSDYYNEAQKLCGSSDYYKRPNELFARAFECWIYDEIHDTGGSSDYLVHSVGDDPKAAEVFKGNPYPSGDERKSIGAHMKEIAETVKPDAELTLASSGTPHL